MGRRSSIEQLPQELFDEISRALNDGKTLDEIIAHLKTLGAGISRAALGRHKKKIEEIGESIRRSRMIAEAIGREFGDQPDDKLANLNIELLHDQVMKLITKTNADPDQAGLDPKELNFMADSLYRLAAARKMDADRFLKVRKETAHETIKAIDGELKAAKQPGITREMRQAIERQVLGVKK